MIARAIAGMVAGFLLVCFGALCLRAMAYPERKPTPRYRTERPAPIPREEIVRVSPEFLEEYQEIQRQLYGTRDGWRPLWFTR